MLEGWAAIPAESITFYVVMNGKVDPTSAVTGGSLYAQTVRTIGLMTKGLSSALLAATERFAREQGLNRRTVYLPADLPEDEGATAMETQHMRQLYDYGLKLARSGNFWRAPGRLGGQSAQADRMLATR